MKKNLCLLGVLFLILPGCEAEDNEALRMAGAAGLSDNYKFNDLKYTLEDVVAPPKATPAVDAKAWLGTAAMESIGNCNKFLARLGVVETGTDTILDIASLGTAAAAAGPGVGLAASKALAVSAAFLTGTRGAIDADIYGKAAAPLIVQKVRSTYYVEMKSYIGDLKSATVQPDDVPTRYAELLEIHQSCSLQAAIADISSKDLAKKPPTISQKELTTGTAKTYTMANGQAVKVDAPTAAATLGVRFGGDDPVKMSPAALAATLNAGQATLDK